MGTMLHMRTRDDPTEYGADERPSAYGVYDDQGRLVATVKVNPTSTDDFELELQRWGTEPVRRLITQEEALGYAGPLRAEELVQEYFPEDTVELGGQDAHPNDWLLAPPG